MPTRPARNVQLLIDGQWRWGSSNESRSIYNPATEEEIGHFACACERDLEDAAQSALRGFEIWSRTTARTRSLVLGRAAALLKKKLEAISQAITSEQGKPLYESRLEVVAAAEVLDWFSGEAIRTYGRTIPARQPEVIQQVVREPVGPVAAFTPWNFPVVQSVRKLAAALAAGCSIVMKGPEEAPTSCSELFRILHEAGVPNGAINLVFGHPKEISEFLIAHPAVRKVSFTGSVPVGRQVAALAGRHMKRSTMELGGHAPAIVFNDADLDVALEVLTIQKFRNAGQVCVSPTRFLVQDKVYEEFVDRFSARVRDIKIGDGALPETEMGPLAHGRRVEAMETMIADAKRYGAHINCGGVRLNNKGHFFAPTIICEPSKNALVMNDEPFGPVVAVSRFSDADEAIDEANRLPVGLAAYAYTRSSRMSRRLAQEVDCGMLSINHHGLGLAETPFGGVKDSGYGSEGGIEGMEPYLRTKFVSEFR
jgi:succinate-semialdehyde dehydrogenase/glutarate-semialdehyde dehydrogenase